MHTIENYFNLLFKNINMTTVTHLCSSQVKIRLVGHHPRGIHIVVHYDKASIQFFFQSHVVNMIPMFIIFTIQNHWFN